MANIINTLPVTIYGNLEKFNEVISKGRCRIFYKGANRNGTFITDEFAEKLLSTIAYAPVKGIYDIEGKDFTDHGQDRDEGRIYGIVPNEPNLTWEVHKDEDGIERTYATVDVLIYTGLYKEANQIVGKSQSMELYRNSIKGDWQIIQGKRYFVYTEGCFLGLQALGDEVEPCFEGAAFFSMYQSLKDLINQIENNTNFQKSLQGGNKMEILFKVSDGQKYEALWSILNPNYNEENNWAVDCVICEVYDDYAVVKKCCDATYERVYYVKDDETDSISISERKRCFIVDVDEEEKDVLDYLRKKGCHTYTEIEEHFNSFENLNEEISSKDTKISECELTISTLTTERDQANEQLNAVNEQLNDANTQYSASQEALAAVTAERDSLASYKKSVEDNAKSEIIASYTEQLSDEVIESYTNNMDQYSIEELDMKLTYEVKKAHPEVFNRTPAPQYIPKDEPKAGIESILSRYEKH